MLVCTVWEVYRLLLISAGTFVTACSGFGAGLKVFFFWGMMVLEM